MLHIQRSFTAKVKIAPPAPDEILVKLAACAICHSDIMYIDGGWGGELPAVYGHEAAGVVEALGDGVDAMALGDHVVVTLKRLEDACDTKLRAPGFPSELIDAQPENQGEEIKFRNL